MLAYEVIKAACQFSDNDTLADKILSASDFDTDFTDEEKKTLTRYLECLNYVQEEVASEFKPLKATETFKTENFKINFNAFKKIPLQILSVKDNRGGGVKFKVFPTYLMAFASEVEVTYGATPIKLDYDSQIEVDLPQRVLGYGVAREYYLRQGLTEDAEIYENRFKGSLKLILRKKAGTTLPRRRWL